MTAIAKLLRRNAVAIAGAALALAVMAWLGLTGFAWTDYDVEAAAAFKALIDGNPGLALDIAPAYGGSFVLRIPIAIVVAELGGGELAVFRAGSLALMATGAAFGLWLVARMRALGHSPLVRATALTLCIANPVVLTALDYGHPEEILIAAAMVGSMCAAIAGKPVLAGALLGIAVASKLVAVVAIAPVLVVVSERFRCALVAMVVAAVLVSPLVVASLGNGSWASLNHAVATDTSEIFHPWQVWWWAGEPGLEIEAKTGEILTGFRSSPEWVRPLSHPAIVLFSVVAALAWLPRARRAPADGLLLLAIVLLARCALDVWNIAYYAVPFVVALLAWETLVARRPPVFSLMSVAVVWLLFVRLVGEIPGDALSGLYLAVAVAAGAAMSLRLYAPELSKPFWTRLAAHPRRWSRLIASRGAGTKSPAIAETGRTP